MSIETEPNSAAVVLPTEQRWERRAVIDLSAIRHNVRRIAELAAPAQIMAVVKADGYGHGALPVAKAALEAGATWLGTAHATEALELRAAGITAPVLAWLHTTDTPFAEAIAANIDLGVSGWDLDHIAAAARTAAQPARVHLKIDTGLGRNGCTPEGWRELLAAAAAYQEEGVLRVVGVFSHLAVADEPERPETDEQLAAFRAAVALAEEAGFGLEVRHTANTPAILSRPDAHFDLVRLGLGMYGLSPFADQTSADLGLRPAMRLVARVANAKRVPAGQGISYGLTYRTAGPTTVALVPLGYADGIPRTAQAAPVLIAGVLRRSSGRVAMDQFVVDMGEDADPADLIGAEAVLFGDGGPAAEAWAASAGTINYEMVTRISGRVPRHYVEGSWGEHGE
ncbi:alanine racemase [Zafaria cholistanensis]|uniref:Alanine racemase n=1 Tax=Zafaria cholistanensis TaxID=1682741 RepID=A0A5A7NL81_9MICC|nr:alanine racemase [Zafaria cholistanensis]GER21714.1 alanine racemase [Zafaria cholistanensis]